jgi:hypothetical protein
MMAGNKQEVDAFERVSTAFDYGTTFAQAEPVSGNWPGQGIIGGFNY